MTHWTEDYIHTLSIDPKTLRDGEKQAQPGKWTGSGTNDHAAWGLVQGSAKQPYRVCIDFSDTVTKCTCPSRKFPCKHAVGLMLVLARGHVPRAETAPEWVSSWLESRQARKTKAEQPSASSKAPDPAAKAKREAARLAKVAAGIDELRLFLEDLVRNGLDDPRTKTYNFWDRIAARMVDAQMQPVARRLRALGGKPFQRKANWAKQLADEIGQLYALTEAYLRIEALPESLQHDVRSALGFTLKAEEIAASQPAVTDRWIVVGQRQEAADTGLTERRTWLYGITQQKYALLLDFSHSTQQFTTHYPLGQVIDAELAYYPGAYPLRAVLNRMERVRHDGDSVPFQWPTDCEQILDAYADALACNPFLARIPAGLQRAYPTRSSLIDPSGKSLPIKGVPSAQWLQAVTGGDWLPVFGEWDGEAFLIVSLLTTEGWISASNA